MSGIINYIKDNEFRINIYENKVNVVNYIDLLSMEEERISLTSSIGRVIIKGDNLSVRKLLNKELIIVGKIKNIEIGE